MIEFLREKFDGLVLGIFIPFILWYLKIVAGRLKNSVKSIIVAEIGDDIKSMIKQTQEIQETVTKLQITYVDVKNKQKDVFILIEKLSDWCREMSNIQREHHKVTSKIKDEFYNTFKEVNRKYRS